MKAILLAISLLYASVLFGQKLMNAKVERQFDEFGVLNFADSSAYSYSTTQGFFNEFKPVFRFDTDGAYYVIPSFIVHATDEDKYNDVGNGLVFQNTNTNTLTNDLVTLSDGGQGFLRRYYDYTPQGLLRKESVEVFNGSIWEVSDSTVYQYNTFGDKIVETRHQVLGLSTIIMLDSLFYQSGTSNVIGSVSYNYNGVSLVLASSSLITYNGSEIEHVDNYQIDANGDLAWSLRLEYNWFNGSCAGFDAYFVDSNVIDTSFLIEGLFSFNAQNNFESYTLVFDADTLAKLEYTYDMEGFVTKESNFQMDNVLYLAGTREFYFTDFASVVEVQKLEVSVFPNPTTNVLRIQTDEVVEQIDILNMNGQLLMSQNIGHEIDVSHLPKGIYILKGKVNNQFFNQTFVKQ